MNAEQAPGPLETAPRGAVPRISSKFRLELRKDAAVMVASLLFSASCGHLIFDMTKSSDKMRTKTEEKERKTVAGQPLTSLRFIPRNAPQR